MKLDKVKEKLIAIEKSKFYIKLILFVMYIMTMIIIITITSTNLLSMFFLIIFISVVYFIQYQWLRPGLIKNWWGLPSGPQINLKVILFLIVFEIILLFLFWKAALVILK